MPNWRSTLSFGTNFFLSLVNLLKWDSILLTESWSSSTLYLRELHCCRFTIALLTGFDDSTEHVLAVGWVSCWLVHGTTLHPACASFMVGPGKVGAAAGLDTGPATLVRRYLIIQHISTYWAHLAPKQVLLCLNFASKRDASTLGTWLRTLLSWRKVGKERITKKKLGIVFKVGSAY